MKDVTEDRITEFKLKITAAQTFGDAPKRFIKPSKKFDDWFWENSERTDGVDIIPLGFVSCPILYANVMPRRNKNLHSQIIRSILDGTTKILFDGKQEYLVMANDFKIYS